MWDGQMAELELRLGLGLGEDGRGAGIYIPSFSAK
jgi:hypothetical protein